MCLLSVRSPQACGRPCALPTGGCRDLARAAFHARNPPRACLRPHSSAPLALTRSASSPGLLLSVGPLGGQRSMGLPGSDFVLLQEVDIWPLPEGSTPEFSEDVSCVLSCTHLWDTPHGPCHFLCRLAQEGQPAFHTWHFKFRSVY